jgi:hypothetical protein
VTTRSPDARSEAQAHVNALLRQAVAEWLWLPALFFLLFRKKIIAAELASREPAEQQRTKSPFVYDMR